MGVELSALEEYFSVYGDYGMKTDSLNAQMVAEQSLGKGDDTKGQR